MKEIFFTVDLRIRLMSGEDTCFGTGVAELLTKVKINNSLKASSVEMNLPYKKALKIVARAEETFGKKLLERQIGGKGGGGSQLTPFANNLIDAFKTVEAQLNQQAQQLITEKLAVILQEQ